MRRRQFIQTALRVSGLTVAGSMLAACSQAAAPPAPTAPPQPAPTQASAPPKPAATQPAATQAAAPAPTAAKPAESKPTTAPAAPAQTAAPVAKPGGTLNVAMMADMNIFDPATTNNPEGRNGSRIIHDALFGIDQEGRLTPQLVESWQQPDDRTYVLQIRQGIKFHDGTPLDAEAVKFNLDRMRDPKQSTRSSEVALIDTVEAVDAKTVRLGLSKPFSAALYPMMDVVGFVASPTAVQQLGKDYAQRPVGAGPFKLVEYQKDVQAVFEKNPDYWDRGKPYVDRIVIRPIPVDATRLAELRSGGVHLAYDLPFQDIRRLKDDPQLVISEKTGFRWEYFLFNTRPEHPGANQKFRQAFHWAIDRQQLHEVVYFGTGAVGYDCILPGTPYFDADYKPYTQDLEKAKRLLDESGVSMPISITTYMNPDPPKQRAAQIVQETVDKIGVKITLEQMDTAAEFQRYRDGNFVVRLQGWWGYRPDPDQYLSAQMESSSFWAKLVGYSSPKMDELLNAERTARNETDRRKIFRQIAELVNEDAVYIPWHYGSDFKGMSPKVKGFVHYQDAMVRYQTISLE